MNFQKKNWLHTFFFKISHMIKHFETTTVIDQPLANDDCAYIIDSQSEWLLCSCFTLSHRTGQHFIYGLLWNFRYSWGHTGTSVMWPRAFLKKLAYSHATNFSCHPTSRKESHKCNNEEITSWLFFPKQASIYTNHITIILYQYVPDSYFNLSTWSMI